MKKQSLVVFVGLIVCGCGSVDETGYAEQPLNADGTVTRVFPPGTYNGEVGPGPNACDEAVTCCVSGGRPFNTLVAFESRLAAWGCDAPRIWSVRKMSTSNWGYFTMCPKHDALGDQLGGVSYQTNEIIPGPLTDFITNRHSAAAPGYSDVAPIWSAFVRPRESCTPPPVPGKSVVTWDPNCPSGCAIDVYQ